MKATVVWSKQAQDRLAEIWLASTDPQAVTLAADRIDAALATEPLRGARRISQRLLELEVLPLVVSYSYSESDQRVLVESVMELGPLDP